MGIQHMDLYITHSPLLSPHLLFLLSLLSLPSSSFPRALNFTRNDTHFRGRLTRVSGKSVFHLVLQYFQKVLPPPGRFHRC